MITFLTVVHISTIVLLVIAVLLQSGKGAEISATFGGSSQTVFGSSGGQNFFQKLTYGLAAVFMLTPLTLTILPGRLKKSVFEGYTPPPNAATLPNTAPPAQPGAPIEGTKTSASGKTEVPMGNVKTQANPTSAGKEMPKEVPPAPAKK